MEQKIIIYNTLTRKKEVFEPLNPPFVGIYVCGPTVYGDAHLGHARPAITFDLVFRYFRHLGYKVRYVRNITDVGHLENDADAGEDKIAKKARIEQLEPMEVVQYYTDRYHTDIDQLNVLKPSIEPRASGHIIEQIEMIKKILEAGYAYESNGSVYFDVEKYSKSYHYGKLSGRVLEDLRANSRELEGQEEKRSGIDFALWKKAQPEHIMRWPSPWSEGFPGWHLECSVMSIRYLGETFDIHGGGLDLQFPHHECEIAQSQIAVGHDTVRYWMHNNMVTINGQKMAKSLGNFITLEQFFKGDHPALVQAFSPMTIRFFMLQAHYRSTLDFSNEALQAAEKGCKRLMEAGRTLQNLVSQLSGKQSVTIEKVGDPVLQLKQNCYDAINDDFNSPVLISFLFEAVRTINSAKEKADFLTADELLFLQQLYNDFVFDILGLKDESLGSGNEGIINGLMDLVLVIRQQARANKDWPTSDKIRDDLAKLSITIKDSKEGSSWNID
ncbi:MAG: cysteine--tRNA ligase [Bacteroidetes bacterium]|nr:cysteine--tRNA ligase [Bacteroidota bacterium]